MKGARIYLNYPRLRKYYPKKKKKENITLAYILKIIKSIMSPQYAHIHGYNSTICNWEILEAAQMLINGGIDKDVVF